MKKIILILSLATTNLCADLYSEQEISDFLNQQMGKSTPLIENIVTSSSPAKTLKSWLLTEQDELIKEQQLFSLLDHMTTMPPSASLLPILNQLSQYQAMATKMHSEASHPSQATEAVFNIASKAAGVQNIWLMKSSQRKAIQILTSSNDSSTELLDLISASKSRNATYLGIKNAILNVSDSSIETFKQQLQINKNHPLLHPIITDLALITKDMAFTYWAIEQVNKQQAERIYRQVVINYPASQSIEILTQNIKSEANPAFIASLLSHHIDRPAVSDFLIGQLENKSAVKGAAYALSKSQDPLVWKKMEQVHNNSNSKDIRKSIRFSFKQNKQADAQIILQRLENNKGAKS